MTAPLEPAVVGDGVFRYGERVEARLLCGASDLGKRFLSEEIWIHRMHHEGEAQDVAHGRVLA